MTIASLSGRIQFHHAYKFNVNAATLETIESLSKSLSLVASPVVIGIIGWLIKDAIAKRTLRQEYVKIAVSILSTEKSSKGTDPLREWAVELLNQNSPTKFGTSAISSLESGEATLPSPLKLPVPPRPGVCLDLKAKLDNLKVKRWHAKDNSLVEMGDKLVDLASEAGEILTESAPVAGYLEIYAFEGTSLDAGEVYARLIKPD